MSKIWCNKTDRRLYLTLLFSIILIVGFIVLIVIFTSNNNSHNFTSTNSDSYTSTLICGNYTDIVQAKDNSILATWKNRASSNDLVEKLQEIRRLSPFGNGMSINDGRTCFFNHTEICYSEGCLDSALFLLKSINSYADPCDNFYKFSCGSWIVNNPVPPKLAQWDNMDILKEKINNFTQDILESFAEPSELELKPLKDARQLYKKCVVGDGDEIDNANRSQSIFKKCATQALDKYRMVLTVKFVDKYFDKSIKAKVDQMVEHVRSNFREVLSDSSWMDDATKVEAEKKLSAMSKLIAYPNWVFNKTALEQYYEDVIEIGDLGTMKAGRKSSRAASNLKFESLISFSGEIWSDSPLTVNAFYNMWKNSIIIPTGILLPPYYINGALEALNYAGTGTTIAHEIAHGFDPSGSAHDYNGHLKDWWTSRTWHGYKEKSSCFRQQYSKLMTEAGQRVDGESTLDENIADNVGLRLAFNAYQKWIQVNNDGKEEPRLPGLEMYTPQQLFFLGYANSWCESFTEEDLEKQLLTDPHTPARFRVVVPLQNFQEFSHHWQCPVGSHMNPTVDDKCILW